MRLTQTKDAGLTFLLVICHIIKVSSVGVKKYSLKGNSGESDTIKSSNFPNSYPGNWIYEYKLEHRGRGSIVIQALDFSIHPLSVVKVYNGHDVSSSHRVYFGHDRPVFQSSGKKLMLVFKTGNVKKHSFFGFRIKYKFVSYYRSDGYLSSLPAQGVCGPQMMIPNKKVEIKVTGAQLDKEQVAPGESRTYYYSCHWLLKPNNTQEYVTLHIKNITLMSGLTGESLKIGTGLNSALPGNQLAEYTRIQKLPSQLQFQARSLYVQLNMHMGPQDFVHIEYYTEKSRHLSSTLMPRAPCKFKTCNTSTGHTCRMYWSRCKTTDDISCEVSKATRKCQKVDRCFTAWDMCDNYQDCGSHATDETECKCSSKKKKVPTATLR